ncbi:heparin sulfate O-sulfotransferase isoform X1 [Diprion similis]|uniref:heparin sulfate O-sulfotransferase isoform X1 n=1 Tax=Diprion similis TaxID=362088 RepID=UPI001EF9A7A1|nr:heparin sulfate O-sulfotransferase isoform X1 [Diprion similis]
MIVRTLPVQWFFGIVLILLILYFKIRISYLEESTKILQDALAQVEKRNNIESLTHTQDRALSSVDDVIVIYNRVPKTGSTSFVGIVYDLCKQNKYHSLHINVTNNMHTLTLPNQMQFVNNITQWDAMKPAFYHGHIAFLNFEKFGVKRIPLYINLLRKPLDRFVSYYYFLRYGDNFRPHLIRKKHGDTKTFDECVRDGQPDCDPNNMWLQVPFLCGHEPACWEVGNPWAVAEAKRNVEKHYLLVGVTEELPEFVQILQATVPRFFKGAYDHFMHNSKSHLRQTTQKIDPLPETVKKIQNSQVWQMENDLYMHVLAHFHAVKKRVINATPQEANQHFMYEKIRPK